jgi:hypothetical protein
MVQTLGKLSERYWNEWEERGAYFQENGEVRTEWERGNARARKYPLEEMIADIGGEEEEDCAWGEYEDESAGEHEGGDENAENDTYALSDDEAAGSEREITDEEQRRDDIVSDIFDVADDESVEDGFCEHVKALIEPDGNRVPAEEATQLLELLARILKYDPADRMGLAEILKHSWLS